MKLIMPVLAGTGITVFRKTETAKYLSFSLTDHHFKFSLKKNTGRRKVNSKRVSLLSEVLSELQFCSVFSHKNTSIAYKKLPIWLSY